MDFARFLQKRNVKLSWSNETPCVVKALTSSRLPSQAKREGRSHSLWINPASGAVETVLRHVEIPNRLARKICKEPGVADIV